MMSVCKCVPSVQAIEGGTITTFDPPSGDDPPTITLTRGLASMILVMHSVKSQPTELIDLIHKTYPDLRRVDFYSEEPPAIENKVVASAGSSSSLGYWKLKSGGEPFLGLYGIGLFRGNYSVLKMPLDDPDQNLGDCEIYQLSELEVAEPPPGSPALPMSEEAIGFLAEGVVQRLWELPPDVKEHFLTRERLTKSPLIQRALRHWRLAEKVTTDLRAYLPANEPVLAKGTDQLVAFVKRVASVLPTPDTEFPYVTEMRKQLGYKIEVSDPGKVDSLLRELHTQTLADSV